MRLRDATGADADRLLATAIQLTEEAGGGAATVSITAGQLGRDLDAGSARALVLETDEGYLAGIAFYSFVHFSLSGRHLYLDDLWVAPDHRNAGLGDRLMRALARRGLDSGAVGMAWQVEHDNRDAIRFYERLGARLSTDRRFMAVAGLDELAARAG